MLRYCKALKPLVHTLIACWDETLYKEDRDDRANRAFDPAFFTQTCSDPMFVAYLSFITMLDEVPEAFAQWCESCDCHEELLRHCSQHLRQTVIGQHYKGNICSFVRFLFTKDRLGGQHANLQQSQGR